MDNEKHNRVVALRFADGLRVDITREPTTHFEAIAEMTARALRSDRPPTLPLYEAATAIIPADRIAQPLNGEVSAIGSELAGPIVRPEPIPINGLRAEMRRFGQYDISGASPERREEGKRVLAEFFARYGVEIDFTDGVPEWLKLDRAKRDPAAAWTGEAK